MDPMLGLAIDWVGAFFLVAGLVVLVAVVIVFVVLNLYALLRKPVGRVVSRYLDWLVERLA